MARKARSGAANNSNGVDGNGGNSEGANAAPGGSEPGGGSGDGGSGGDSGDVISPKLGNGDGTDNGDGGTGTSEPRRGRGRPAGSRTQKKAEISVGTLADVIAFAHVGLASVLKNDAWALDETECKRLADASAKVLRHYDTPAISAQAMDWIGLLMVAGNIYGPRIAMAVSDRKPRPAPQPATRSEPQTPRAEQGDGFVIVNDPLGRGGPPMRVPVNN